MKNRPAGENRPFRLLGLDFEPVVRTRAYRTELQGPDACVYACGLLVVLARAAPEAQAGAQAGAQAERALLEAGEDLAGAQLALPN